MNFVKTYNLLDTGDFDLKTGKKQYPQSNLHYASTLSPVGKHSSLFNMIKTLPVPQPTSNRLKTLSATQKIQNF